MSLVYLSAVSLKNRARELLHSPSRLIVTLLLAAILIMNLFTMAGVRGASRPVDELYSLILAVYLMVYLLPVLSGFDTGASFFSMADVHFLFPAPILSRRVLLYGLVRQMGTSLMVGFFLLFQYSWLHMLYGVTIGSLLMILAGYGACIFCGQITAMAIYTFISGNENRRRAMKAVLALLLIFCACCLAIPLFSRPADPLGAVTRIAGGPLFSLFPVAGWLRGAVSGFLAGDFLLPLLLLALTVVYAALLIMALLRGSADFYEDVLLATEVSYSAITAKKEGTMTETAPRHVKVGKMGIGRGNGSNTFYYKHMLENRRSRVMLLDKISMIFLVMTWGYAWLMRDSGIVAVLFFSIYLQIFTVATGRWARELLLPHVYLLPEKPFRKLWNICREGMLKNLVEAAAIFFPVGYILRLSLLDTVACVVLRAAYGLLFIAGNVLVARVLGTLTSKMAAMLLYILLMAAVSIPGLILGVFIAGLTGGSTAVMLVVVSLWNVGVSALILLLCSDMLDCAELNNR